MLSRPIARVGASAAAISVFALMLIFSYAQPASAATFTVTKTADTNDGTCDADCSLREAIVAANAAGGADTIDLPAGTYTLSIAGAGEDAAATGDLDITDDLTITGVGSGTTIIDAAMIDRVFHVLSAATVDIVGVAMENGDPGAALVGAIFNDVGTLTLTNSTARDSRANVGGGIYNGTDQMLTLTGSTVSGVTQGAGIVNGGTTMVTDSMIIGNTGGNAGGIHSSQIIGSILTVTGSTISGNTATVDGGGIRIADGGTLTVTDSTVSGNSAPVGGGIIILLSTATLLNVTVSDNTASSRGGGIDILGSGDGAYSTSLTNVTISGNSSPTGGGISNPSGQFSALVFLTNTIVADQVSGADCAGDPLSSGGHNLDSDDTCNLTDPDDLPNTNPQLGSLADNGGPTETQALLAGSPAIDAGDDGACPAADQRGVSRPLGAACDIGAYESDGAAPTPTPTPPPAEPSTGTPTSAPAGQEPATATATPAALPNTGGASDGSSGTALLLLAGVVGATLVTGGWYARRRWLR